MNQSYNVLGKLLDNRYRLIHHLLFVGIILSFWFLFMINGSKSFNDILKTFLYASTYVAIAYLNIYFLFPRYLLGGKPGFYLLLSLLTFFASYVTQNFIFFKSWEEFYRDLSFSPALLADMTINAITYCMFIGIGLSVKMVKMWLNSERRILSLEQENLKARLNNLRSQVSPHFLFNTFNNLYVLSKTQPQIASEMILGFSDLMRYQLNECDRELTHVENEVHYIHNFLELEKLRKDKLDLKISYDRNSLQGVMIEPLLFATFVENAVKHGSQQMENGFIHVSLERRNSTFIFEVVNSKPEMPLLGREESTGKGIDNLKKRLALSYPNAHRLDLRNGKTEFRAKLEIELK